MENTVHHDNLPTKTTRPGPKPNPTYEAIAAALRSKPKQWYAVSFNDIPGRTIPLKSSNLIKAMALRRIRVTIRKIDDTSTYVKIVEDYGGAA